MTEPDFLRATRASYDAVAADYAERFGGDLAAKPLDRRCWPASPSSCRPPAPASEADSSSEAAEGKTA